MLQKILAHICALSIHYIEVLYKYSENMMPFFEQYLTWLNEQCLSELYKSQQQNSLSANFLNYWITEANKQIRYFKSRWKRFIRKIDEIFRGIP